MVRQGVRRVEDCEHLVADEFEQRSVVHLYHFRHLVQHPPEERDHLRGPKAVASFLEAVDVAEEDRDALGPDADLRLDPVREEPLHHGGGHVERPRVDGALHRAESLVQLDQLVHNFGRAVLAPGVRGGNVPEVLQQLERGEALHVVHQPAQGLQDGAGEHGDLPVHDGDEEQEQRHDAEHREDVHQSPAPLLQQAVHQHHARGEPAVRAVGVGPAGLREVLHPHARPVYELLDLPPGPGEVHGGGWACAPPGAIDVGPAVQVQVHDPSVEGVGPVVVRVVPDLLAQVGPGSVREVLGLDPREHVQLPQSLRDGVVHHVDLQQRHGPDQDEDAGADLDGDPVADLPRQRPDPLRFVQLLDMAAKQVFT
mmetsp:Transcript_30872/g.86735  ORF Transcript_30872/g.86735 Transcript_30872/m.86735 type:complete len:368 (-) Transcript_30872:1559-2662(-)